MTHEEIITMCQKLAGRYKRQDMVDDLVSEGVLAVYERLAVKPDEYPASLYKKANKAMYDYLNIACKPVTIPKTRTAESILKKTKYGGQTHSDKGKAILEEALHSSSVSFDDNYELYEADVTEAYETNDFFKKALATLDEREEDIIKSLYFKDMSQVDLAKVYGVHQSTISLWEKEALYKMSVL